MQFDPLLEKIINHFTGHQFNADVQAARHDFFENAGVLDETAQDFDHRMALFLDWYVFTRELSGYAKPPIDAAPFERELRFEQQELNDLKALQNSRHSLFEFIKIKKSMIFLKDLIAGEKILVEQTPTVIGFHAEEIFEGRVVQIGETYQFLKGFCFHPIDARKFILKETKALRKDRDLDAEKVMMRLMKMKYRFEQYKHVKFEAIYNHDSKI